VAVAVGSPCSWVWRELVTRVGGRRPIELVQKHGLPPTVLPSLDGRRAAAAEPA
jgi:hypothetical protein